MRLSTNSCTTSQTPSRRLEEEALLVTQAGDKDLVEGSGVLSYVRDGVVFEVWIIRDRSGGIRCG